MCVCVGKAHPFLKMKLQEPPNLHFSVVFLTLSWRGKGEGAYKLWCVHLIIYLYCNCFSSHISKQSCSVLNQGPIVDESISFLPLKNEYSVILNSSHLRMDGAFEEGFLKNKKKLAENVCRCRLFLNDGIKESISSAAPFSVITTSYYICVCVCV